MLTMHWQSPDLIIREESPTLLAASSFDGTQGGEREGAGQEGEEEGKKKKRKKKKRRKSFRNGECSMRALMPLVLRRESSFFGSGLNF